MGKEKIPRQPMPSQEPQERIKNFREVPLGYSSETAQLEAGRCIQCKKPKCIEGCPVFVDIPGFIQLVVEGKFDEAAKKVKETNILPAICGRVCPQEEQCEIKCILSLKGEPVAIGRLERFVADFERTNNLITPTPITEHKGKKVAIIGAGPAGLTAASDLALMGYEVTIFEALHKPGGVLVYGIPEFRLPKLIVEAEINYLKTLGVKVVVNFVVGPTRTIDELMTEEHFDAVFIGTGAGLPKFLGIPGENLNGVYSANEFLTRVNLMAAYRFPEVDTPIMKRSKIAVLGAGNTAMDSARSAKRLGAEEVYIVYRRSREEAPARKEEIEHAEEEGIIFNFLMAPVRILGDEHGWVKGMECIKMELGEPDESGRRRPVPIPNSEFILDVDMVINAIGSGSNQLLFQTAKDIQLTKWGNIIADEETGATSKRGVFAGGDIVTGAATVILAMGAGKKAASSIDKYLSGKVDYWEKDDNNGQEK